jgi:hypothetical protein
MGSYRFAANSGAGAVATLSDAYSQSQKSGLLERPRKLLRWGGRVQLARTIVE